jgi:hypothetical protein
MSFFGMVFWVLILWFLIRAWRRSQRCLPIGPRGSPGWYGRDRYDARDVAPPAGRGAERQEYIDSLESRITELEERLDFTERLLAGREK